MIERHELADRPTHRHADEMSQAEAVKQAHRILDQITQRVLRSARLIVPRTPGRLSSRCERLGRGSAARPGGVGVRMMEGVERSLRRDRDDEGDVEGRLPHLEPEFPGALTPEQGDFDPDRLAVRELSNR
jgi:hypothetical protein